jgi:hypothetical protein
MVDWGIPDWRSAENYQAPPANDDFMRAFAWEFLRRNLDYRNWWKDKVEPFIGEDGTLSQSFEPLMDDDSAGLDKSDLIIADMQNRFGLAPCLPPSPKETPGYVFFEAAQMTRLSRAGSHRFEDWQVGYVFDLRLPLDEQFEKAVEDAKYVQARKSEKGLLAFENGRATPQTYLLCLRILDAYDWGAKTKRIAATLFAGHEDPVAALKKTRKRALYFRDEGYRHLAALSISPERGE